MWPSAERSKERRDGKARKCNRVLYIRLVSKFSFFWIKKQNNSTTLHTHLVIIFLHRYKEVAGEIIVYWMNTATSSGHHDGNDDAVFFSGCCFVCVNPQNLMFLLVCTYVRMYVRASKIIDLYVRTD